MSRDRDGNYVNEKGVTIKVSEYEGGAKIDFYDKSPRESDHKSIHTHINDNGSYKTEDNVNGSNERSSGGCYLTTACMKYMQERFEDNCYELTVLRWFRDNFVSKEDIKHYYETSPVIVESINEDEKSDLVYNYIYDNVVDYCVKQIENGNYEEAYNRYKNSILVLEEQFARKTLEEKFIKILKLRIDE